MTDVAEDIIEPHAHRYNDVEMEHARKVALPVMIGKIDCVTHHEFCRENLIMAYPTLRLYVDGERWPGGDYFGHRTVVDMADYLSQVEDFHKTEKGSDAPKNVEQAHRGT
jgi:Thioredoxin